MFFGNVILTFDTEENAKVFISDIYSHYLTLSSPAEVLGDEVEECPHSVLEEELVCVVERDAGREVALHGAALQPRWGPNSTAKYCFDLKLGATFPRAALSESKKNKKLKKVIDIMLNCPLSMSR